MGGVLRLANKGNIVSFAAWITLSLKWLAKLSLISTTLSPIRLTWGMNDDYCISHDMSVCGTSAVNCENTGSNMRHVFLRNVSVRQQPFEAVLQQKRRTVSQEHRDVLVVAPDRLQASNIYLLINIQLQLHVYIHESKNDISCNTV